MRIQALTLAAAMFFLWSAEAQENPWREKVEPALKQLEKSPTVDAFVNAFDTVYRADDWQAGVTLVEKANTQFKDNCKLRGRIARALWRSGDIWSAETLISRLSPRSKDPIEMQMQVLSALARGEIQKAGQLADHLVKIETPSVSTLMIAATAWSEADRNRDAMKVAEAAVKQADPKNGYPEIYVEDLLDGVVKLYTKIGNRPVNIVTHHGVAQMTALALANLPCCKVTINGHGPYDFILDTGGSIMVGIDKELAKEIEIPILAEGVVHGIGGKESSQYALLDELKVGGIRCERVMAITFDAQNAMYGLARGIIGTGIFADCRMTVDFAGEKLVIEASKPNPATGEEITMRLVADAKIATPVVVNGKHKATAILDTGADHFYVSPRLLRELFPDNKLTPLAIPGLSGDNSGAGGVGSEGMTLYLGTPIDIDLGKKHAKDIPNLGLSAIDDLMGPMFGLQSDVLIGMKLFRDMERMVIDYPRRRLWISWYPDEPSGE